MATETTKTLGGQGARLLADLSVAGKTVFTIEEARQLAGDDLRVRQLLYRLEKRGWVQRLERGKYLILPLAAGLEGAYTAHEFLIASKLISPYAIAYGTALRYYGYSDLLSRTVYVATTRRKRPLILHGLTYRFVTVSPARFFGIAQIPLEGQRIYITDREKTIVDCLTHPPYAGGVIEAAKGLWFGSEEIDLGRLVDYAEQNSSKATMQRLGFWLERLGMGDGALLRRVEAGCSQSYVRLETPGLAVGHRDRRWRVIVNIAEDTLLEWREH
ncbi:MAG: type IV toxin-antitoxin system AbiEi family antitoxin domain-containing protein [Anaerolineae bacterium]